MATTVAAYGKVKTRALRGETMPEGWMIDRKGRPLTDPKRADEGMLLPLGGMEAGYKGRRPRIAARASFAIDNLSSPHGAYEAK